MKRIWYKIRHRDPIWFTLLYLFFLLTFTTSLILVPDVKLLAPTYFKITIYFLLLGPLILALFHVFSYKETVNSMYRIASLYMQIVIMFGCIYFVGTGTHTRSELKRTGSFQKDSFIAGIEPDWIVTISDTTQKTSHRDTLLSSFKSLYDSMHFSLMTSTTVGYGDMYPRTTFAKVLVDIQVLVSFFLIAFGVGQFFSQKND